MPAKKPLKKTRCLQCRKIVETTVLGRCPHCMSLDSALAADWQPSTSFVRILTRPLDKVRLAMSITTDGRAWRLTAYETRRDGSQTHAEIVRGPALVDVVREGDYFARRWIEGQPGTSLASFVPRPSIPS